VFQVNLHSQQAPIKWKEVSMDELKMTQYEPDTSAGAVILCDYGQRYFNTNPNGRNLFLFMDRHVRIKILKPEGVKYAHIRIAYKDMVCENFPEELSLSIKGMTYNLEENGKVVASKLKNKSIKRYDSTGCYRIVDFTLPNVKPGSIIEYRYTVPTLDLIMPENWYFQNELPTLVSEFRLQVPNQFSYLISPQNFTNYDKYEESDFNQSIPIPSIFYRYYYNRMSNSAFINITGKQIKLTKYNLEKIANQSFVKNPANYQQYIKIHLTKATKGYSDPYWDWLSRALVITTNENYELYDPHQRSSILYPAGYIYYKLPDWGKFTEKLLNSDRFGLALIKHWNYEEILKEIVKDKEDPEQKLIAIYDFIRKNMKWNGEYSLYVDPVFNNSLSKLYTRVTKRLGNEKSLRKPFEEGIGSSSEINFLLIYLLNKAGIETSPVIISTRDHGLIDTIIPEPKQFNHVIAFAEIGEKQYFLDAIDSLRPYNMVSQNDLSSQALLIKKFSPNWLDISNYTMSKSIVSETIVIDNDLNTKTEIEVKETGFYALEHKRELLVNGKGAFEKSQDIKYGLNNQVQNIDIQNIDNDTVPLEYKIVKTSNFQGSSQIEIRPNFDCGYPIEQFKDEIRKYPVEFDFPFKKSYLLEITIPIGYKVELPEYSSFQTYGNNASYIYKTQQSDNKVQIYISLEIKQSSFPQFEYENLKQLFTELNDKIQETIKIRKLEN
jgi:hypothetical protein